MFKPAIPVLVLLAATGHNGHLGVNAFAIHTVQIIKHVHVYVSVVRVLAPPEKVLHALQQGVVNKLNLLLCS